MRALMAAALRAATALAPMRYNQPAPTAANALTAAERHEHALPARATEIRATLSPAATAPK